jgi:hypothetical protein
MDYLPIFIAVTAAAVVIQAGILVALYLAVRQTSARMEALATEVTTKVLPTAEIVHSMLVEYRPLLQNLVANLSESSSKWPMRLIARGCRSSVPTNCSTALSTAWKTPLT